MTKYLLPILVLIIIGYGLYKKTDIYDTFIEGAKESFDMIFKMFPSLLGMILGVNIFIKSNFLNFLFQFLGRFITLIEMPIEVFSLGIIRPISGGASLALLNNLLENFGPDSLTGRIASVMQGSTDTTFYVLTLYFGTIGIKKIKHSLWVGLFADLVGLIVSIFVVKIMF
ncbi:MAG: spore maturation protein [Bacilli bacterium]